MARAKTTTSSVHSLKLFVGDCTFQDHLLFHSYPSIDTSSILHAKLGVALPPPQYLMSGAPARSVSPQRRPRYRRYRPSIDVPIHTWDEIGGQNYRFSIHTSGEVGGATKTPYRQYRLSIDASIHTWDEIEGQKYQFLIHTLYEIA